jgi:hypothetical protein
VCGALMKARVLRYHSNAFIIDIVEPPFKIYSDRFGHSSLMRISDYNCAIWLSQDEIKYKRNFIKLNEMQE